MTLGVAGTSEYKRLLLIDSGQRWATYARLASGCRVPRSGDVGQRLQRRPKTNRSLSMSPEYRVLLPRWHPKGPPQEKH
eukprot:scaffold33693_cov30-Phaeocystis_antarctica.AAC.1